MMSRLIGKVNRITAVSWFLVWSAAEYVSAACQPRLKMRPGESCHSAAETDVRCRRCQNLFTVMFYEKLLGLLGGDVQSLESMAAKQYLGNRTSHMCSLEIPKKRNTECVCVCVCGRPPASSFLRLTTLADGIPPLIVPVELLRSWTC